MRNEQEQIYTKRIEPVLTGVQTLELEALLETSSFQPMRREQEQIIYQLGSNLF
jgi:hypothetical protein